MRLIDADALNLDYEVDMADDWKTAHEMANLVRYAETVDAIPVIRCKDCKYSRDNGDYRDGYYCTDRHHNKEYEVMSGDFCSWAERKEE